MSKNSKRRPSPLVQYMLHAKPINSTARVVGSENKGPSNKKGRKACIRLDPPIQITPKGTGVCTGCGQETMLVMAFTNHGLISLCPPCLALARKRMLRQSNGRVENRLSPAIPHQTEKRAKLALLSRMLVFSRHLAFNDMISVIGRDGEATKP